ncbi:MAG: hypothetical protein ACK5Y2_08075 [Bdellovibrionales bacterium]
MPKGIPINTQADSILSNVKVEIVALPEKENNERIKRLARKILRAMENDRGRKVGDSDDFLANSTLEQDIAI